MKRLSSLRKARLERVRRRRWLRQLRRAVPVAIRIATRRAFPWQDIAVPAELDFDAHFEETAKFFETMRRMVLTDKTATRLVFDECKKIAPDAALALAAEVDRCRTLRIRFERPMLTGNYPAAPEVARMLCDIGFYRHLRVMGPRLEASNRFVQIRSGVRDKGDVAFGIAKLVFDAAGGFQSVSQRSWLGPVKELYGGLLEAMNNVTAHAYPQGRNSYPILAGRWWMAAYSDPAAQEVRALLYDQGVGIPETLPATHEAGLLARFGMLFRSLSHGQLIAAAIELGRSKTREKHRGKGMAQLLRIVTRLGGGRLRILSLKGSYLYDPGQREQHGDHRASLGGTLIEWCVRWDKMTGEAK